MKIVKVEAIPVSSELKEARRFKAGEWKTTDVVIVKVYTDEGLVGVGEAASALWYGGYSQNAIVEAIESYLSPLIIGEDPFDIESIIKKMDGVLWGNPFAKCAIDMALHDLIGKSTEEPVFKLIGGKVRSEVEVVAVMHWSSPSEAANKAIELVKMGFKHLKLKCGIKPEVDVERVKAVREAVGSEITIRVDFNELYSPDTAIKVIKRMEKFEILFAEQPVPRWDLRGMAKVAAAVDTPISADDSLFSPEDALKLIMERAADIFNIYIMEAGGFLKAKKIAAIAEAADIPCLIGAMPGLALEDVAGLHLAASTPVIKYACEFVGSQIHKLTEIKEEIKVVNGRMKVPEKPGLGVELDEKKIKELKRIHRGIGQLGYVKEVGRIY